jgi:hypothetical protein
LPGYGAGTVPVSSREVSLPLSRVRLAVLAVLLLASVLAVATYGPSSAASHRGHRPSAHGVDVSWPQCRGTVPSHLPRQRPRYAVLGLTDGAGFTANPCLAGQVTWAEQHHVPTGAYLVPTYPTPAQTTAAGTGPFGRCAVTKVPGCRLRNAGAGEADDAVDVMHAAGLRPPIVWIDVEGRDQHPWHTRTPWEDRAVVAGVVRGLQHAGIRFGVYTTGYMWREIVGPWRLDVPNWLPVGNASRRSARRMCSTTATGGPTWQVQWTTWLDHDMLCPAFSSPGERRIAR